MKSALVHYWLTNRRGGEVVLEALSEILPDADLFSHVIKDSVLFGGLRKLNRFETFIAKLPKSETHYNYYLPLMPLALEMLDMSSYDVIVSSEAGPAKWIIPSPEALHICYCHSPMRYIWDQKNTYFKNIPSIARPFAEIYASRLRKSDILSSTRVDQFVANSVFVSKRIWKYYRRDAVVVNPPINVGLYSPSSNYDDHYLIAGEIVTYKRVDLAVRACTELGRRLRVVGGGNVDGLKKIAGPTIEFVGKVDDAQFRQELTTCRALLFPGLEDFGIVPVEAMASGRPVIAFGKGGAVETVDHGVTGLLFLDQTVDSLKSAILEFEAEEGAFTASACVGRARKFGRDVFLGKMAAVLGVGVPYPKVVAAVGE